MQDMIKQWPILSLLPMCTTDAGLSIKCGWSGSLTILLKWLSPKLKIKSHRVGKHSKESLSFIDDK